MAGSAAGHFPYFLPARFRNSYYSQQLINSVELGHARCEWTWGQISIFQGRSTLKIEI